MKKVVISASSLPAGRNMSSQIEYLQRVTNYGADMYHLDVMDGEFVKYKTLDYQYLEQLREKSPLLFDVHLMVKNPEKVIDKYIKNGANIITVHYEVFDDKEKLYDTLQDIKKKGAMCGLAIDLDTDIVKAEPFLKLIDLILIMSVKAGKGGQTFDKKALKKIRFVRNINQEILISVDGGINDQTGAQAVKAGADILSVGSYIYNNDTFTAIQSLKGKNG